MLRNKWVAAVRGFADRGTITITRQTRRPPTHNRHKTRGRRESTASGLTVLVIVLGLRNPVADLGRRRAEL